MVQVPAPVLLADLGHELAVFGLLDRQEHLEEFLAQGFAGPARPFQGAQCGKPVGGQELGGLFIAVADDGGARVELLANTVVDAGENRRGRQVRVGIGAADAVLDMAAKLRDVLPERTS